MTADIIPMRQKPKTYTAKAFSVSGFGPSIVLAGTLDGYIDMAIGDASGHHYGTWQLDRYKARALIAALHGVIDDITANCLFDQDALLEPLPMERT